MRHVYTQCWVKVQHESHSQHRFGIWSVNPAHFLTRLHFDVLHGRKRGVQTKRINEMTDNVWDQNNLRCRKDPHPVYSKMLTPFSRLNWSCDIILLWFMSYFIIVCCNAVFCLYFCMTIGFYAIWNSTSCVWNITPSRGRV